MRGRTEGKVTLLSRSNFNVFEDAVALTGKDRTVKVHMIGVRGDCQRDFQVPKPVGTWSSDTYGRLEIGWG